MTDPIMSAVASAIVSKAADAVAAGGRAALDELVRLVRGRLGRHPDGVTALQTVLTASLGGVVNQASGPTYGHVIQARDIHGPMANASSRNSGTVHGISSRPGPVTIHQSGGLASQMPVPRQLPLDVVGFTGRESELTRLDELLLEPGAAEAPVIITGAAGVGKTALVVHWATVAIAWHAHATVCSCHI